MFVVTVAKLIVEIVFFFVLFRVRLTTSRVAVVAVCSVNNGVIIL